MPSASSAFTRRAVVGLAVSSGLLLGASVFYVQGVERADALDQKKIPEYEVVEAFDAPGIQDVSVSSGAARESGMRLIARDLRKDDLVPQNGTMLVEYYDEDDTSKNTGFALVFDSEKAVLDAGASEQFGEVYNEDEAGEIMDEQDGVRVVSYRDFKDENSTLWGKIKSFLV